MLLNFEWHSFGGLILGIENVQEYWNLLGCRFQTLTTLLIIVHITTKTTFKHKIEWNT